MHLIWNLLLLSLAVFAVSKFLPGPGREKKARYFLPPIESHANGELPIEVKALSRNTASPSDRLVPVDTSSSNSVPGGVLIRFQSVPSQRFSPPFDAINGPAPEDMLRMMTGITAIAAKPVNTSHFRR